jgi:hypothetical protein
MFTDPDGMMPDEFSAPHFMPSSPMFHDPRTREKEDNNINLLHGENNREYNKWDDLKYHIPGHDDSSDVKFFDNYEKHHYIAANGKRKKKKRPSKTNITVSTSGSLFTIGSGINVAFYLE